MADSIRVTNQRTAHTHLSSEHLLVKLTLLVTSTFTVMAGATVAPALPAMQAAFETFPNIELWVRLVLTIPALFIAFGAPFAGYIVDRFGRKNMLIGSMVLYGLSGGAGLFAPTLPLILLSRALLGVAVAGLMTSVTTLIADYYTGARRSAFLGIQSAGMGIGGMIFLTFGGFLADVGWRMPFALYLLVFAALPFVVFVLHEPTDSEKNDGEAEHHTSQGFPVGLMIFAYLSVLLIQMIFYVIPVNLPFYLETLVGANAATSGIAIASLSLFFALSASMFGWLDKRMSHVQAVVLAFSVTGIAYALIGLATDWALIAVGLPLGGFAIGLMMPNLNVWLANSTPTALRGRALGGMTMSVFIGQFISPLVMQPLVDSTGIDGTFIVIGAGLVVLGLAVLLFRKPLGQLGADSHGH